MSTDPVAIKLAIEQAFRERAESQDLVNPAHMKYRKAELEFFAGAMAALQAVFPNEEDPTRLSRMVPPSWIINLISGKNIAS